MATTTASGKKHIYLNNKNLEELIFNYRKNNRKYEQTMYESVYKLGTNFLNQFKFLGYPQQVKEDMLQTFLFNFFNSINKGKFSIRTILQFSIPYSSNISRDVYVLIVRYVSL
jgi:hypothetical protein